METGTAIEQAITFIENHLYEPLTASMAAFAASYSYSHFHRYFSAVMGETPGEYIRGRRLAEAARQLIHSDKKILDIGMSLCFETAESFSRAFKKKYGISPREYRKNGVDMLSAYHAPKIKAEFDKFRDGPLQPRIVSVPPTRIAGLAFPEHTGQSHRGYVGQAEQQAAQPA